MARKALHIVANEATKRILGQLGSPLVQVAVKGRVVKGAAANTLVIENISTSKSNTLPIIASPATKRALSDIAGAESANEITLLGRVASTAGGNILILDRVGKAQSMAIVADAGTRAMLADLAKNKGESEVRVKVIESGGAKVIQLCGTCGKKGKK